MKSLKELTASKLAVSERVLSPKEASMVIAVIKSMRGETSDYDVDDDNKLKHWHKERGIGYKRIHQWKDLQGNRYV